MIVLEQLSFNIARISHETDKEKKALDHLLERRIKDPRTGLFDRVTVAWLDDQGSGFIPAGLIPYLKEKLESRFRLDVRLMPADTERIPVDASCFVNSEPRDYQIDSAQTLLSCNRGIMKASTGSGKTRVIGGMCHAILRAHPDWRIMVMGFTNDHWMQVENSLKDMNLKTQEVGKGKPKLNIALGRFSKFEKMVSTTGAWNNWLRTAEVLCVDETRHCGSAQTYIDFLKAINPVRCYGFDATPLKNFEDGNPYTIYEDLQLTGFCGPILVDIGYKALQKRGYIPLTYVHFVPMPKPPSAYTSSLPRNIWITTDYTKIYKYLIVENDFRTARFARLITNLAAGGKVIAMVKQHEHARRLMAMLMDNGIESLAWFGDDVALAVSPTRGVYNADFGTDEVRRRFMETDLSVVVGSNVLSEAISLDVATDAVNLAAGNTFSLTAQRAGRIMRRDHGRTPVVRFWDAADETQIVLKAQSTHRREHYIASGVDVVDIPCTEVLYNMRDVGLTRGRIVWEQ